MDPPNKNLDIMDFFSAFVMKEREWIDLKNNIFTQNWVYLTMTAEYDILSIGKKRNECVSRIIKRKPTSCSLWGFLFYFFRWQN